MEASKLKEILKQHRLWIETNGVQGTRADLSGANLKSAYITGADLRGASLTGANLTDANLRGASLTGANLEDTNLTGANLEDTNLTGAIGLPYVSWIIPGCLAQLNHIKYGFWLEKENKYENFIQDSLGFFIQDNLEKKTFDMLVGDRIIRNIPDWVKYSGMKKIV
jgi:hypothetical protein